MNKKTKKILIIIGLSLAALIAGLFLFISFIFYELLVKPTNDAIFEAKSKAAYLLQIADKTTLKKVGEAGMAETIDNNNHCYTYAFQGAANYITTKNIMIYLLSDAGYSLEPTIVMDSAGAYKVRSKTEDGWITQLQIFNDTALVRVAADVIDNTVSTKAQVGQVLVSGQVCNG